MVFQSEIPNYLATHQEEVTTLEEDTYIFGTLEYNQNFDAEIIKKAILEEFEHGCQGSSSHVIILEPEDNLNSNQAILEAANMYKADFNLLKTAYLDIVANDAIFHHLVRCQA
ncbi:hypothetical protein C1645_832734 [Glomus cerebriforme]|uniref:Uncharacterized protein n=1 Tax=Glomus cerebriforme TaxID=658196 RepID=A0A397SDS2_9GLOM|nr:hypothetical protein C1645_832734 [Glomus cerebriforme]